MGVYLGQSIYNESQVTPEWVHDEIAKNGKGVFFATHRQTTYQNILQEYNNGKIIVCKYAPATPGETTTYYFNLVRFNTETFEFVGVMQDGTIYRTGINVNEGWINVTSFKLDEIEFVEYNVDSYTTIKNYYDDGKFIVLKYLQQTPLVTKYYFYPLVSVDETNKEIVFGSLELGLNNKKITFTVTDSTGWAAPVQSSAVVVDVALDSSSHNPVENAVIAAELTAINNKITGDLNDIFLALASKGVTVPAGAGLDDVAGLIDTVPTGAPEPIINPNIKTCLWVSKNNNSSLMKSIFFNIDINDTIEFTFSPDSDILAADYTGSYGSISGLIMLSNAVIIGYNYGNIVLSTNFSAYNNNVVVGDLIHEVLYNVKFKNGKLFFNSVENNSNAFNSNLSYIQYPNQQYNNPSIKFYEIKILDSSGVPYKRFVPAKNPNNAACLYECYSGNYYTFDNGGILGPEMPL